jgi:hypothetical protein
MLRLAAECVTPADEIGKEVRVVALSLPEN